MVQVSALSLILALALLVGIAHLFSRPILRLAEKARLMAQAQDAGELPAPSGGTGEIAVLESALHEMLGRVLRTTAQERSHREDLQKRLEALRSATDQVAEGKLRVHIPCHTQDDIGRLEAGFNAMVASLLQARRAELQAQLDLEWARDSVEQANRRLQELDRRKSDFLNTASHELRTPLTSIRAFAEIIEDSLVEGQTAAEFASANMEFLSIIDQESERLSRLIGTLLDLSKIESDAPGWEFSEIESGQLVERCVRGCQALVQEKQLELKLCQDDPISFRGAPDPLLQVLTNLLSNAIKFTAPGGQIEMRIRTTGTEVIYEIEDSGIGITPEDQSRLFHDFQQAEGVTDESAPKGSGLGLAICRDIVERHLGVIKLSSQVGKGSCFSVRLPLNLGPPGGAAQATPPVNPL